MSTSVHSNSLIRIFSVYFDMFGSANESGTTLSNVVLSFRRVIVVHCLIPLFHETVVPEQLPHPSPPSARSTSKTIWIDCPSAPLVAQPLKAPYLHTANSEYESMSFSQQNLFSGRACVFWPCAELCNYHLIQAFQGLVYLPVSERMHHFPLMHVALHTMMFVINVCYCRVCWNHLERSPDQDAGTMKQAIAEQSDRTVPIRCWVDFP